MARREIRARTREEMVREYPIEDKLAGWYFRITETSNEAWLVEGCDVWGRRVSRAGSDPEKLLSACVADAAEILGQAAR